MLTKLFNTLLVRFQRDIPLPAGESVTIEMIDTDLGNQILESLKSEGWIVAKQYSPLAFDKGIDFDSYVLKKDGRRVDFEWTNWLEWTISGDKRVMAEIGRTVDAHKIEAGSKGN